MLKCPAKTVAISLKFTTKSSPLIGNHVTSLFVGAAVCTVINKSNFRLF